jgi:uroporphyrinogen-III synthase
VARSRPGRVLITRSQPGAARLAEALERAGFATQQCPLLEIRPRVSELARDTVAQLDQFDLVIFVSGHAVRFGMQLIDRQWRERPQGLTWIAVGAATGEALARHGITAVVPEEESSEGILDLAQTRRVAGRRVLIVAGRGGRAELANAFVERGARVERLELYAREAVAADSVTLPDDGIAAVVVSSADGGHAFAALWRSVQGDFSVPVIVPSARVAAVLRDLAFTAVVESGGASAAAVIDAVQRVTRAGNENE